MCPRREKPTAICKGTKLRPCYETQLQDIIALSHSSTTVHIADVGGTKLCTQIHLTIFQMKDWLSSGTNTAPCKMMLEQGSS